MKYRQYADTTPMSLESLMQSEKKKVAKDQLLPDVSFMKCPANPWGQKVA